MASNQISKPKTITLNINVISKIEQMAQNQNRNFSNMIETILLKELKEINR